MLIKKGLNLLYKTLLNDVFMNKWLLHLLLKVRRNKCKKSPNHLFFMLNDHLFIIRQIVLLNTYEKIVLMRVINSMFMVLESGVRIVNSL